MKNFSAIVGSIVVTGAIILFSACNGGDKKTATKSTEHNNTAATGGGGTGRIAYVNIDTLEANYTYLKQKKDEFTKRQAGMQAELERSMQQLQRDAAEFSKKAQAGALSQTEGEAGQKRLLQMQESLEKRKNALSEQLMTEQEAFNKDLHDRLDAFLKDYNADKKYDYILSYSEGGAILYKDESLDITTDVIEGMNSLPTTKADTSKKK
jgi:outer membrane protein